MSTLHHTSQAGLRIRPGRRLTVLAALVVMAAASLTVVLVASEVDSSTTRSAQPSHVAPQRQLEAVSGPRYGLSRPAARGSDNPTLSRAQVTRELQAVAGARYRQPVGIHARP
jgi:hypothetical protein